MAADFFIVAEGEIDGSFGDESVAQQMLDRLENRHHARLVIHGAAAPYVAVGARAGKRRMAPILFGCGNNVHVRHQQNRFHAALLALPGVEEAVAADGFLVKLFADMRKRFVKKS